MVDREPHRAPQFLPLLLRGGQRKGLIQSLFIGSAPPRSSRTTSLSDGAHFENLGAYEVIRRQGRLVIAGDAEGEPETKLDGPGRLMRVCRVDFGVDLPMEVCERKRDSPGWSRRIPDRFSPGALLHTLRWGEAPTNGDEILLESPRPMDFMARISARATVNSAARSVPQRGSCPGGRPPVSSNLRGRLTDR